MHQQVVSKNWRAIITGIVHIIAQCAAFANFPPVCQSGADQQEVFVGQQVRFSSNGTIDPDEQPKQLSFQWNFGDGTASADADPIHSFSSAGAYIVTLEVTDGADQSVCSLVVIVLDPPTQSHPSNSSPIFLSEQNSEVWVVNPDSDSLSILNWGQNRLVKQQELATGKRPRTLCLEELSGIVFVACEQSNELWAYSLISKTFIARFAVGTQPYAVAAVPGSRNVLVSVQGNSTLAVVSEREGVAAVIPVRPNPRAIAVSASGRTAFVTHFLTTGGTGFVSEIDLLEKRVIREIPLPQDPGPDTPSSSRGFPNLLSALTIEPGGRGVWVGGYKSNSARSSFLSGESLNPFNTVRGYLGRINIPDGLEQSGRRIDPNNADSISSIAFTPNGRYALVTHQGAETLSVYDIGASGLIRPGDGNTVPFLARVEVGSAPQGLCLTRDGKTAFVANFLSRTVAVLDIGEIGNPRLLQTVPATTEPLPEAIANGKRLFYSSKAPRHSRDNYIACASCHADGGGHDGRTWDFTNKGEGLRNTIDLRGKGGMAQGPLHWSGNFDEVQDFEHDIIHAFGGAGLSSANNPPLNDPLGAKNAGRSQDLDDLAAYVTSLTRAPASPFRRYDGILTLSASRGKSIFNRADVGCAQCHSGPAFTDSSLTGDEFIFHDVGTLRESSGRRLNGSLAGLDTPSLLGLWSSAPYLHDGRAATLWDVLRTSNPQDQHGATSQLAASEMDDLINYLLSLDLPSRLDAFTDEDQDGLADAWEQQFGIGFATGLDDGDGDGVPNLAEYVSGTDPSNSRSLLKLRAFASGEILTLSLSTQPQFIYYLEASPDLAAPVWRRIATISGDGALHSINVPRPAQHDFFRLQTLSLSPL